MTANFDFARVTPEIVCDLMEIFGSSGVSADREKAAAYSKDEVAMHLWKKICCRGGLFCRKHGTNIKPHEICE